MEITPEELGLRRAKPEDILGGEPAVCREHTMAVLRGEPGPKRDMVLMNAAATLLAAGVAPDMAAGVEQAARSIDSGAALAKLEELSDLARGLRPADALEA
jgi:anthranilate phosphoribosyltransferase